MGTDREQALARSLLQLVSYAQQHRRVVAALVYTGITTGALGLAYLLHTDFNRESVLNLSFARTLLVLLLIRLGVNYLFKLGLGRWRYVGIRDFGRLLAATTAGSVVFFGLMTWVLGNLDSVPISIVLLEWVFTGYMTGGIWVIYRALYEFTRVRKGAKQRRVLVIGAGEAAQLLVAQMLRSGVGYLPVGILDDDKEKKGTRIHGVQVLGPTRDVKEVSSRLGVEEIVIGIPSATSHELNEIVTYCEVAGLPLKIMPGIDDVLDEDASQSQRPVLVVGGGGYIGTHLVEMLLDSNYKVRIFDKFVFGREVLGDLDNHPNLEVIEGDISNIYLLTLALRDTQAVIHLAGLVGDPASSIDDNLTQHFNIVSTRILLESAKALRISRFIFASSCSVYGASDEKVNEESDLNPVSAYAKSKIDSEKEILASLGDYFHPTILRFATVFGHSRRARFDLVTNLFTAQAFNNGKITVLGSKQWRPMIHVSDIARGIVKVLGAPIEMVSRQVFNVGDDDLNITIGELAEVVSKVVDRDKTGRSVHITVDDDIQDTRNYRVSFEKIKNILGFRAQIGVEEGIIEITSSLRNGRYTKPYGDGLYSNVQMTKMIQDEFYTREYRENHLSILLRDFSRKDDDTSK